MKKALSVFLSVLLILSSLTLIAFADNGQPFYVVLGDSIAFGSGLSNPREACYGKIIADTNGYEYANHSIPGHTTQNLINRLSEEKVIEDVRRADIISISIGGNDFLMNNLSSILFSYIVKNDTTPIANIEKSFYDNFCIIMDIINENNEDAVVLMQTLYNPQFKSLKNAYQAGGDAINRAINRYNEEHPGEIIIIDVAPGLNGDESNFADDGVHPSAKGNEIIAQKIADTLYAMDLGYTADLVINENGRDISLSPLFSMYMEIMGRSFTFLAKIRKCLTELINF